MRIEIGRLRISTDAAAPVFSVGPVVKTNLKAVGDQGISIPHVSSKYGAGFGDTITDYDREYAVQREPIAYRVTYMVADDVFDKWFTVNDPQTKGGDPDLDRKVQESLRALNKGVGVTVKAVLQQALGLERVHGWSLLVGGFDDAPSTKQLQQELREGAELQQLFVYAKPKATVQVSDTVKDEDDPRYGEPEYYTLDRGSGNSIKVHWTRCYKLQTRPTSVGVLDPIWDDLTCLRNIRWGMGQTMFRYGSGFPIVKLPGVRTASQLQTWIESGVFETLNARTQMVMGEGMEFEFKGAQGAALNPDPYYRAIMENISAGTGIPEAALRGAQAGALTGSEVNEREYFKVVSALQSRVEPCLRWVIDKLDVAEDYEVEWVPAFEATEREQMEAELLHEQANNMRLNYMTVDEVRANEELQELPNGEGKTLLSVQRIESRSQFPGLEALDVSKNQPHTQLVEGLKAIVGKVKSGSMEKADALREGSALIQTFGSQERERARSYVAKRIGRPLTSLAPEQESEFKRMDAEYLANFEKILDDVIRRRG